MMRCRRLTGRGGGFAAVLALLLTLFAAAGCEPCAGTLACVEPSLSYQGEVIVQLTGEPAPGVRVVVRRVGGVEIEPDSLFAVTDSLGRFRIDAAAREEGTVEVVLSFLPPPPFAGFPFSDRVVLSTSRVRGDIRRLGAWGVGPLLAPARISYVGELVYAYNGSAVADAEVEFQRVAGPRLAERDTFVVRTDSNGRFAVVARLKDDDKFEDYKKAEGFVYGRIVVRPPPPYAPYVLGDLRFAPSVVLSEVKFLGRWVVGGRLAYVGEVFNRHTGQRLEGAEVSFRRTGGIALRPQTVTARTGADGRFLLEPEPLADGEVVGDLAIRSPLGAIEVREGIRLETFTTPGELRFFGTFGVGPRISYVGELVWLDTFEPASGVEVHFRRTGGIALRQETVTARTSPDGRFLLEPEPLAEGTAEGEIVLRRGTGEQVIATIRLESFREDAGIRFLGRWPIPRP